MKWLGGFAVALALLAVQPASAQQALYEPLPPKGSAYVRFFNALAQPATVSPDFAPPLTLGTGAAQRVGPYTVVENVAGRSVTVPLQAAGGQASVTLALRPGSYNTVLWLPGGDGPHGLVLQDESEFNQLRAKLTFYNATANCKAASLAITPDGPEVFQNVPPAEARMRAVNPVEATLRARCDGRTTRPFDLKGLREGGRSSIWLIMTAEGPLAFLTEDATTVGKR